MKFLRRDALGRVRTPRAKREEILDEFERSGMSGAQFAELAGIKYPTLANWVQRRRRERGKSGRQPRTKPSRSVRFLEAVVENPPPISVPSLSIDVLDFRCQD